MFTAVYHELILTVVFAGDHTKITLNTKNVFIDITATDLNKVSNYGLAMRLLEWAGGL